MIRMPGLSFLANGICRATYSDASSATRSGSSFRNRAVENPSPHPISAARTFPGRSCKARTESSRTAPKYPSISFRPIAVGSSYL